MNHGASDIAPVKRAALTALGNALRAHGYEFVCVTPNTHKRVLQKDARPARTLRDVFGWNRDFTPESISPELLRLAERADVIQSAGNKLRSRVRFSTLGERLFVHSGFPTRSADAVFFGPDSYRFCNLLEQSLERCTRLVDVGCGTGVGGLCASAKAEHVILADVNQKALEFADVNADLASVPAQLVKSDVLAGVDDPFDVVIANPPYMLDASGRTYRDGGGELGEGLAIRIVREALERLQRPGTLILYTGAAIVDGVDVFRRQVVPLCREAAAAFTYSEIDPDVFGEELDEPNYLNVERIAAVALVVRLPG